MKRLTIRENGNDFVFIGKRPRGFLCKIEFCDKAYNCEKIKDRSCPYLKMVDRLAAIEDILGDEYDLDRLRELAQADREGISPCTFCRFNPPSSGDGKPCCMCPAEAALRRERDG